MSPFNQDHECSNSDNALVQEMDEAPQDECNRNRWSNSDASGSSSIATFFEIVNPSSQSVSGSYPNAERFKSNLIVVIEDSYSTAFEFENLDHFHDYKECHDHLSALSPNSSPQHDQEDGIDRLDGILLPDFFTYTSEERELIRHNLPILRNQTQLNNTREQTRSNRSESTPTRDNNLTYHLPTKPFDYHQHSAHHHSLTSSNDSDILGDSTF